MAMTKLIPAAGYLRRSTKKQETSIERQRKESIEAAKREGLNLGEWHEDDGISGESDKRPGFDALCHSVTNGGPKVVVCWSLDRLTRKNSLANSWANDFRRAGVRIYSATEGWVDLSTMAGRTIFNLKNEVANQENQDRAKRVLSGLMEKARQGDINPHPLWGFDRIAYDGSGKQIKRIVYGEKYPTAKGWKTVLVPNPEAAPIVLNAYHDFVERDLSLTEIARQLNKRGVRGARWQASSVSKMLANPAYAGAKAWGRNYGGKHYHASDDGELVPLDCEVTQRERKAPVFIHEDTHEAIVDKTTWKRAQEKLAKCRKMKFGKRKHDNLLTGVLLCGSCGRRMYPTSAQGDGNRYYRCVQKIHHGGDACNSGHVRASDVEGAVLEACRKRFASASWLKALRATLIQRAKAAANIRPGEVRRLTKQLKDVERKAGNALDMLIDAPKARREKIEQRLASLEAQKAEIEERLAAAGNKPSGTPQKDADAAVKALERLGKGLKARESDRLKAAIRAVVSAVVVHFRARPVTPEHRRPKRYQGRPRGNKFRRWEVTNIDVEFEGISYGAPTINSKPLAS